MSSGSLDATVTADDQHGSHDEPAAVGGPRRLRVRVAPLSLAIAAAVLIADQLTKHWAVNALSDGRPRHVIWTLQWNLAYNSGMAFSRGRGLGPIIGVVALVVVVAFVIGSARVQSRTTRIAMGLLIGGALGNVTDRVFRGDEGVLRGAVVDFIDFQWFPIFNVADIGVDVGAALFVLGSYVLSRRAAVGSSTAVAAPGVGATGVAAAASTEDPSSPP